DAMGDPSGDGTGLTGAGTSENANGAAQRAGHPPLLGIQFGEDRLGHRRGIPGAAGQPTVPPGTTGRSGRHDAVTGIGPPYQPSMRRRAMDTDGGSRSSPDSAAAANSARENQRASEIS